MKKTIFLLAVFAIVIAGFSAKARADFVCPVFNSASVGQHNPNAVQIGGGDWSIIGPNVNVPARATNMDGAGSPPGQHASPGDPGYSAIWSS